MTQFKWLLKYQITIIIVFHLCNSINSQTTNVADTTVCSEFTTPNLHSCYEFTYATESIIAGPPCDDGYKLTFNHYLESAGGIIDLINPLDHLEDYNEPVSIPLPGGSSYKYCVQLKSNRPSCTTLIRLLPYPFVNNPTIRVEHSFSKENESAGFNICPNKDKINITGNQSFSVAADGSDVSTLTLRSNCIDVSNLDIAVEGDLGNDPSIFGSFKKTSADENQVSFRYMHPTKIVSDGEFEARRLLVKDQSLGGAIIQEYPMSVYRAPLLLVHGLNDSPESFQKMERQLIQSGAFSDDQILRADYSSTNTVSILDNHKVIPEALDELWCQMRARGIISGKAMVVGHSMGGLLSRQFLQGVGPNSKMGIQKLVTINTPHFGSEIGNLVDDSGVLEEIEIVRNIFCNSNLIPVTNPAWAICLTTNLIPNDLGAIQDLAVNSPYMDLLNRLNYPLENPVPSHAIISSVTSPSSFITSQYEAGTEIGIGYIVRNIISSTLGPADDLASFLFSYSHIPEYLIDDFGNALFNQDANDGVVSLSSQRGGLNGAQTTYIQNTSHLDATTNDAIISTVLMLAKENPDSPVFSQNGFEVSFPQIKKLNQQKRAFTQNFKSLKLAQSGNHKIEIINPKGTTISHPNDTLNIQIQSENIHVGIILLSRNRETSYRVEFYQPNITIPFRNDSIYGLRTMLALGIDTVQNILVADTSSFYSLPIENPEYIRVVPESILIPTNSAKSFRVIGSFGGIESDISTSPGLNIYGGQSKTRRIENTNKLIGLAPGFDQYFFHYNGVSTVLPVQVFERSDCPYPEIWRSGNSPIRSGKYFSKQKIIAFSKIQSNENITLTSAGTIQLLPGFHAKNGATVTISVDECPSILLPELPDNSTSFTPNQRLFYPVDNTNSISSFNLFPNPVKKELIVSLNLTPTNNIQYSISNAQGIKFFNKAIPVFRSKSSQQLHFSTNNFPNGIYFFSLKINDSVTTKKFIVYTP